MLPSYEDIAQMIDHSLLRPELTERQTREGCKLARRYGVATVCVKPDFVPLAVCALAKSQVRVGTVVGFPHGNHTLAAKRFEAEQACLLGAREIDMVVNIGLVLSEKWVKVATDIGEVADAVHGQGALIKVIFENCYLEDRHKVALCEICGNIGVDFVKTSTGFGTGGATEADVQLMRKHSPPNVKIKAAGGIRTLDQALRMRELGCARIGATATAAILDELRSRLGLKAV
ncbi:deoxyribose-phosphate aldolase [Candidatus Sumerlaeota bacterium]|nr:deoxyribose-phosphate aldolase [Candidatus Sumerlaeota bacterium]